VRDVTTVRLLFLIPLLAAVGVAVGVYSTKGGGAEPRSVPSAGDGGTVDVAADADGLALVPGSARALGVFKLSRGPSLDLSEADTQDGKSCLFESSRDGGEGRMCLDGGLFAHRRIAFVVDSQGGPGRFTELHVPGVVAPEIRMAEILKTDGTSVPIDLTSTRAFVYESPASELQQGVYPSGFRLYGPSGKLVETVHFPVNP